MILFRSPTPSSYQTKLIHKHDLANPLFGSNFFVWPISTRLKRLPQKIIDSAEVAVCLTVLFFLNVWILLFSPPTQSSPVFLYPPSCYWTWLPRSCPPPEKQEIPAGPCPSSLSLWTWHVRDFMVPPSSHFQCRQMLYRDYHPCVLKLQH